jgi:hypothetical protein
MSLGPVSTDPNNSQEFTPVPTPEQLSGAFLRFRRALQAAAEGSATAIQGALDELERAIVPKPLLPGPDDVASGDTSISGFDPTTAPTEPEIYDYSAE